MRKTVDSLLCVVGVKAGHSRGLRIVESTAETVRHCRIVLAAILQSKQCQCKGKAQVSRSAVATFGAERSVASGLTDPSLAPCAREVPASHDELAWTASLFLTAVQC